MSLYHNPNFVNNGLVLCMDAANVKSYTGSGTSWFDIGGSNSLGTLVNSPTFSATNGGSIVFDGVNDVVRVPYSPNWSQSGSHTVDMWVKVGSIGASAVSLLLNRNNSDYLETFAIAIDNRQVVRPWNPSGTDQMVVTYQIGLTSDYAGTYSKNKFGTTNGDNNWHHIAGVADNSAKIIYLYYDGLLVHNASFIGTIAAPTCDMRIGGEYTINTAESQLLGNVARLSIFNRALSAADVYQNYLSMKSRFGV